MSLSRLLRAFHLLGIARNGREALRMQAILRPDVIVMDVHLPDFDGLELTRRILARRRVPIIVVGSPGSHDHQSLVFEALHAGAYDVVEKSSIRSDNGEAQPHELVRLIREVAGRRLRDRARDVYPVQASSAAIRKRETCMIKREVLAIGASTGGPAVLRAIFDTIGPDFSLPILVAQHISQGFVEGFVRWLNSQKKFEVCLASDGQAPRPSIAYFPPSEHHLSVAGDGRLRLTRHEGHGPCPSVDLLFWSVTKYYGPHAICLLLSGLGPDGAQGLLTAKRCSALTAVQDEETSFIFGMPREALLLGAADYLLSMDEITPWLIKHA